MLNAVCSITLNGITEIDLNDYGGFYLYHFLNRYLPYGFFNLKDRNGSVINKFENLQIGAKVDLVLTDPQDEKTTLTYPTMYILKVEDDFSSDPSKFAGTIKVWFGHPWFLFKDPTNHAYPPMNHSKLIKKILKDKTRGMEFKSNDKAFLETDDAGALTRYKVSETDLDFIIFKILPYTTVQQLPPQFFCYMNKQKSENKYEFLFNLSNFPTMYKQVPKILITPTQETLIENEAYKEIEKICNRNNIDPELDIYFFQQLALQITSEEDIENYFPLIYAENLDRPKFLQLGRKIKNLVAPKSGQTFGNKLPLDFAYLSSLKGSSAKIIKNRQLTDALALALGSSKHLDNLFTLVIDINFVGDKVSLGDTVELYAPPIMETPNSTPKEPWIRGKWLVSGIENYSDTQTDPYKLLTKLYLTRPAFVGNSNTTTLSMPDLFYEVP